MKTKALITIWTSMLILMVLGLSGCGQKNDVVTVKGEPGSVGSPGLPGRDGNSGTDGYSIVSKAVPNPILCGMAGGTEVFMALDRDRNFEFSNGDEIQAQYIVCNGAKGEAGQDGSNGVDGQNGTNGMNGLNGTSCSVTKVNNVSTITCGSSSVLVLDGATGSQGTPGLNASGIYITEIINPCGVEFANDEVFLRLSTGRILALYDGGPQEDRLALIAPGNYNTTDSTQNRACSFTITNDYRIINEVRH